MESLLGTTQKLKVTRVTAEGAWFAAEGREVLLPAAEMPEGLEKGDMLGVFVYLDSEDRPLATMRRPKVELGEVDFLMVTDVVPFGAFVSWGLRKDLLVPLREQIRPMRVGERHAVGLYLDDTNRLAGTTRVAELLRGGRRIALGEWAEGVAWRDEPGLGLFVILEKRTLALLPVSEPHRLFPGDPGRFRVVHVHPGGKIEVSLRGLKHEEMDGDAEKLLALIRDARAPAIGDATSPERIRELLGISKKAFKRAAGRLLKDGRAEIDPDGLLRARAEARGERGDRGEGVE
jgi:predicted RNA-binding protein (virulence factor B family)